ncbi:MAG TPA: sigma 54-interacting transcriptional regulator [Methylomirabilota bacterium]|nr:sigma 54-interacting transcriptional regulator [Methylomirabilota bacterium]
MKGTNGGPHSYAVPAVGEAGEPGANFVHAILEGVSDGILVVSRGGIILQVNQAAAKLVGSERGVLLGRSIHETFFDAPFASAFIAEAVTRRAEVTRTHRIEGRKLLVTAKPLAVPGSDQVVVFLRDVTGLGQLVSRLRPSDRTTSADWTDMRRAESPANETATLVIGSEAIQAVHDLALQCAAVNSPVLLLGETGTGKNVFARLIHDASPRRDGPFHVVNCGAIPEGLLEAELFGYAKGAFTGADSRGRLGVINLAHRGTLVLDEVGDLPLSLQVKLLRFLDTGEVWPVGGSEARRPDVRILTATNRDLGKMMEEGTFRRDLFYRLHILVVPIPPLREHPEDIPDLVDMMQEQLARRLGAKKTFTGEAMQALCRYVFPGNVRELWNLVESLSILVKGATIDVSDLPREIASCGTGSAAAAPGIEGLNLRQALRQVEAHILREALRRYGTQAKAARHLGVGQATVARKTKQHGLGG